jgi:hypothetical protein
VYHGYPDPPVSSARHSSFVLVVDRTGVARLDRGACGVYGRVGPQDLHPFALRDITEAVRDVGRDAGDVAGLDWVFDAVDLRHCRAFEQQDALLAIVFVQRNGGATPSIPTKENSIVISMLLETRTCRNGR